MKTDFLYRLRQIDMLALDFDPVNLRMPSTTSATVTARRGVLRRWLGRPGRRSGESCCKFLSVITGLALCSGRLAVAFSAASTLAAVALAASLRGSR